MDLWADLGWPGLAWPELRGLGWLTPRAGVSAGTAVLAGPPPHVTSDGGASPPPGSRGRESAPSSRREQSSRSFCLSLFESGLLLLLGPKQMARPSQRQRG